MKKKQVLVLSLALSFSSLSNAYIKPETGPDIPITQKRNITSISVGYDGSWYIDSDIGWGLSGCPDVKTMRIIYNHSLKNDYIKLLSLIQDYSKVKLSANATCNSKNDFLIDVQQFITVHKFN
ncbi:hypothetical protein BS333_09285 [Vibrio azureus]|uniref:Uncharacterized protein n=1 Tax=Vibrio azureus NBRC 104587 TaxID=1219077 RepID=U3AKA7_9VIBR|nr:hypothetical protein [Vibrio azureus]AUI86558.1 hypothetical protein BS333_09285 [Vibrio azureus]GAD74180.1 hypothetical protein VAZ01S_004_00540 [Vibrio azureus NBRC 104587]